MRRGAPGAVLLLAGLLLAACADVPVDAPVRVHAPVNITVHCERCTVLPEGFTLGGSDTGALLGGVIRGLVAPPAAEKVAPPESENPPADPPYRPDAIPRLPVPRAPANSSQQDWGWWPFSRRQDN